MTDCADWTCQSRLRCAFARRTRAAGGGAIWLLGRVLLGGLFLMSGIEKLDGHPISSPPRW